MKPVYIFGTGRCGTTHLQRLITLNTDVWIWGEHDGFLEFFFKGLELYEDGEGLRTAVFDEPFPEKDEDLARLVQTEGRELSWLNRLRRDELRDDLRDLIRGLFARRIPEGWSRWGFKEPRYRSSNKVPRFLIDMFPECSAACIFREPAATLESIVRSWYPKYLEPSGLNDLPEPYKELVSWWTEDLEYFMKLKRLRPDRLALIELGEMIEAPGKVLERLDLSPRAPEALITPSRTNIGPSAPSEAAIEAMAASFAP